jgi:hypothetical protein
MMQWFLDLALGIVVCGVGLVCLLVIAWVATSRAAVKHMRDPSDPGNAGTGGDGGGSTL